MKDKSAINVRKSMNRGSPEHETKTPDREGQIMMIASEDVVTVPPTKSIKDTAKIMMEHEFRRIPITDPGSGKVLGIVSVMDIMDFLGGGEKYNIIEKKYEDNFLAAINEPVKEIMTRNVITLSNKASIDECIVKMLESQIGALPIVDGDGKLVAIVTERDIVLALSTLIINKEVQDYMSTKVFTSTPGTSIESACKIMFRNRLRRLPIVGGVADISKAPKKILGMFTSTDLIRLLNAKDLFDNIKTNEASKILDLKVSDVMVDEVITVDPTENLGNLCIKFAEYNIGGVPVVKDGNIVGIITERDVLQAIK